MRTAKRVLLSLGEIGTLLLGFVISVLLAVYVDESLKPREEAVTLATFFTGLLLSVVAAVVFRRKHRARKFAYDVVSWELSRTERRSYPRRARVKRVRLQILPWLPSVFAAFVLFFFPVASHLFHPTSRYLRNYRVPIPWNATVFSMPGTPPAGQNWAEALISKTSTERFGMTPNWRREEPSSSMMFASIDSWEGYGLDTQPSFPDQQPPVQLTRKQLRLGEVPLVCWEHQLPDRFRGFYYIGPWEVQCGTPDTAHQRNFCARFSGAANDLPIFYKIIEGVTPVN